MSSSNPDLDGLAEALGSRGRRDELLAHYTAMRVGGPVDLLIIGESVREVVEAVGLARRYRVAWRVLGGGCNVLVSDRGLKGLVIINRAAEVTLNPDKGTVRAEAGALLSGVARQTVERGMAGLAWAAGLPGSVGGAIVGNAGAFDGDVDSTLYSATVLGSGGEVVERPAGWFEFGYRSSRIKRARADRDGDRYVVLAGTFKLEPGDGEVLEAQMEEILTWRKTRHPTGATMGSTFKNPPDSHAGYLIEQAGLRGYRVGGAKISELHGNFFMNTGTATAADVLALIKYTQQEIQRQFGVELELEIELLGW